MTEEQAKANQDRIAKQYELGWWYGTRCRKCCGVQPKYMSKDIMNPYAAYYECEVCGKHTGLYTMPWLAEEAWNRGETAGGYKQMSLFDMMEEEDEVGKDRKGS